MSVTAGNSDLLANKWFTSNGSSQRVVVNFAYADIQIYDETDIAADTWYNTPVQINYTPKYADSILLVEAGCGTRSILAYGMRMKIVRDGLSSNLGYNGTQDFMYKGDQANHHNDMQASMVVPATSTTVTNFRVQIAPYAGVGECFTGLGNSWIQVTEFQG
jgi:hypothetical protein